MLQALLPIACSLKLEASFFSSTSPVSSSDEYYDSQSLMLLVTLLRGFLRTYQHLT